MSVISDSVCLSTWKAALLGSEHKRVPDDLENHPVITGHECAGVIVEVGKNLTGKYKKGQRFVLGIYGVAQAQEPTDTPVSHDDTIVVTAAEQNLQAPGVSTITADEIRKNPVARDVSEIIRTMPGVNLTGNSTSGQRGNNRQIDIRGIAGWLAARRI